MSIFQRARSPYASMERASEGACQQHTSRSGQEAANDLVNPKCNEMFKNKMSIARGDAGPNGAEMPTEKMAHAAENKDALKAMNADTDMTSVMLEINPVAELFSQWKDQDNSKAVDYAVMHSEMQTHALNDGDAVFRQKVLERIKPQAA